MMLISKNFRQKLTVLAIGSSLFAGCSSGPQLSSIRFWPGSQKMETAADDEAVAQKWRDRLNASALSSGSGTAPGFETAQAEAAAKPRSSRFNIFRRFSRNQEPEAPQQPQTAETGIDPVQQELALQRRIAQLEAEQRALERYEEAAAVGTPRTASVDPRRAGSEMNDPFLAAANQAATQPKKQIVRPAIRPAPQPPARDTSLPSWSQANGSSAAAAPASRGSEVAGYPGTNSFSPKFDESLNNLEAAAQAQATAKPAPGKAPALPLDAQPIITPRNPNPFAQLAQNPAPKTPAPTRTAPAIPEKPQPKLERPVAESGKRDQLASLRSAEEQQRAWAQLEVRQLLKRSRIQARAGQLNEALATALAAEQLANSANVEFSNSEQTPAQLVSLIRLKAEETGTWTAQKTSEPKPAIAANTTDAVLKTHPAARPEYTSQNVSTKTVAPPQWPGRTAAMTPHQVTDDHPLVSTPAARKASELDRHLKTAEFVHPRPAQSVEPHASTSDQWYSADNHPLPQSPGNGGGYMEAPAVPQQSRNEINAQFVSSKSIYSPENLQWTSLDVSRATISQEKSIPAPPVPVQYADNQQELPSFEEELQDAADSDPFAAVFEQSEVSDTLLSSDDPLMELAPTIPELSEAEATETSQEMLFLGIPVRKLGLVLLAGLILLAAIVHRRRTSELHEL